MEIVEAWFDGSWSCKLCFKTGY